MRLHVVTALTRPENVSTIAASFDTSLGTYGIDLCWHVREDPDHTAVGGQAIKNAILDFIHDGWVYICDDDNMIHPALFAALNDVITEDIDMVALAQQHRSSWIRQVDRSMLRETHVDAGQVVIRRSAIGAHRIPEHYCGDGAWIEKIADELADYQIAYVHQPAAYYNWLRL